MYDKGFKASSMKVYLSAIRNYHIEKEHVNPLGGDKLKMILQGAEALSDPVNQKEALTFPILRIICDKATGHDSSLMYQTAFCTAFFGCLRGGEICLENGKSFNPNTNLCCEDIKIIPKEKMFSLFLKRSKTDYVNQGVTVFIGCSGHDTCAFCLMKRYVRSHKHYSPKSPLFIDDMRNPLSKNMLVNCMRISLALGGIKPDQFSAHSFRAGAATSAGDLQFESHDVKKLGRWASNAYERYLRNPKIVASFARRLAKHK